MNSRGQKVFDEDYEDDKRLHNLHHLDMGVVLSPASKGKIPRIFDCNLRMDGTVDASLNLS